MAAPTSAERKACWNARDQLWKCLDDNNDNASPCQKFQSEFEGNCPAQWVSISLKIEGKKTVFTWAYATFNTSCLSCQVKYFAKRRDFLKYKARMETEGFSPAEGPKQPS